MKQTSRLLNILLLVSAVVGAVNGVLKLGAGSPDLIWRAVWTLPVLVAPNLIAGWLGIQVARDYPNGSVMRRSWFLIALSAGAMAVSQAINFGSYIARLQGSTGHWVGLRQHALLVSIVLLFIALLLMWQSFARLGFGLSLRGVDTLAMLGIGASIALFVTFPQHMPDSMSSTFLVRSLQFVNPFLLAALAVLGVLLRRVSVEIGEGQLARSLRYLVLMLMARLLVVAVGIIPIARENLIFSAARSAMSWSVASLFLMAVFERWKLIQTAHEIAEDPEKSIPAGVSR